MQHDMLSLFKIGHFTDLERATGCTVILPPSPNVTSASVKGASPGTREFALLAPEKKISEINALLFTGGSAFGLGAAHAVMKQLAKDNKGYQTDYGVVPLVASAVIFDKNIGDAKAYPGSGDALKAFESAEFDNTQSGAIGAGTGATVGKWMGMKHAMKGGLGLAHVKHGALAITVLSVVNAVGNIVDAYGRTMAGAIDENGRFLDHQNFIQIWSEPAAGMHGNTVLLAIFTNAKLNKLQVYQLADYAHYGLARCIHPSHTTFDGDLAVTIATPEVEAAPDLLQTLTIHATVQSVMDSVRNAQSIHGIPSVKTIGGNT